MNKNLEREYKELITEDVPDLWGKIEAGLEPKHHAVNKTGLGRKYRVWGAAAAAVLSLAVIVPVVFGAATGENKSASDSAAHNGFHTHKNNMAGANAEDGFAYEEEPEYADNEATGAEADFVSIRAKVTEVSEEEGRTVYTVQIEEAGSSRLLKGSSIRLYDEGVLQEELAVGESCLFDFSVLIIGNGTKEYLINNIRYD